MNELRKQHIKNENDDIIEAIGYLQERGYSVVATEDNIPFNPDTETITYIANKVESSLVYPLYEIKSLLDNDKLTNNNIRNDIENMVSNFPQEKGKPEQIML